MDAPDVGFSNARLDPHLTEILGDREQDRGGERSRDGLTHVHVAGDHDTIHGRADGCSIDVDERLLERSPPLSHAGLGCFQERGGDLDLSPG